MKKLVLFSLVLITSGAFAETIMLTSGKVIEGRIIERTDKIITVEIARGLSISYPLGKIENIDENELKSDVAINKNNTISREITSPHAFTCGVSTVDDDGGKTYHTLAIGKQCWLSTNLDYDNGCSDVTWVNESDQGWCGYQQGSSLKNEGLLYQWSAAMNGTSTEGAQGLCPSGWHIPTDKEQHILENYLATDTCNSTRSETEVYSLESWDCAPAGTALKKGGSSGFDWLLTSFRMSDGKFKPSDVVGPLWSSSAKEETAWSRFLRRGFLSAQGGKSIKRVTINKSRAFPVRCLKD